MLANEKLLEMINSQAPYVKSQREWFHRHPELSRAEQHTSERIIEEIEALSLPYERVGDYGLIVRMECGKPGKTVMVRADMDALPVQESKNNLTRPKTCVSETDGVSHACGHDAHMAMVLGAMKILNKIKQDLSGTVLFVFEQAEELGAGVLAMIEALKKYSIDTCYGTHVYAGLESGKISVQPGERMAAITAFTITVHGMGGHASRPDLTISPLMCAASIVVSLNGILAYELDPTKTVTLGIGLLNAGEKGNVIPDTATFAGSLRYYDIEEGQKAFAALKRICDSIAASQRCTVTYDRVLQSNYAVYNDAACAARAEKGITELLGTDVLGTCPPWFATESMAVYQASYPGVFAFLGIDNKADGCGAGHHTPEFDLDEDVLIIGTAACVKYTIDSLKD